MQLEPKNSAKLSRWIIPILMVVLRNCIIKLHFGPFHVSWLWYWFLHVLSVCKIRPIVLEDIKVMMKQPSLSFKCPSYYEYRQPLTSGWWNNLFQNFKTSGIWHRLNCSYKKLVSWWILLYKKFPAIYVSSLKTSFVCFIINYLHWLNWMWINIIHDESTFL